eukprot:s3924_g6.t1
MFLGCYRFAHEAWMQLSRLSDQLELSSLHKMLTAEAFVQGSLGRAVPGAREELSSHSFEPHQDQLGERAEIATVKVWKNDIESYQRKKGQAAEIFNAKKEKMKRWNRAAETTINETESREYTAHMSEIGDRADGGEMLVNDVDISQGGPGAWYEMEMLIERASERLLRLHPQ